MKQLDRRVLLAVMLMAVLSTPIFFTKIDAQASESSTTITHSAIENSGYTGFNITTPTQDGGRVDVVFAWEVGAESRNPMELNSKKVYETYPTLQLIKTFEDGSLDYSLTYVPLYLIQFEDTNGNGLFDVQTSQGSRRAFSDDEVTWNLNRDQSLKMYPLAPMLTGLERGTSSYAWSWGVSDPTVVSGKDVSYKEYMWNVSASVKSFGWRYINTRNMVTSDNVSVRFGYRLTLKPEGPTVKLEYGISGVKWASGQDVKLALISEVLYHGRNDVSIREESRYYDFFGAHGKNRIVSLVENASESVKSMVSQSADAIVDGVNQTGVVSSVLQPVFLVSTPEVPDNANVRGLNPGFGDTVHWQHSVAFAHQIAFPHFDEKVFQDPQISLIEPLLITLPISFIGPQWFIIASIAVLMVFILLRTTLRRSTRELFEIK